MQKNLRFKKKYTLADAS
ncbi:Glutamate synthase (NADPH) large chain [Streptococcus pneumoniae]|nr:Glutamate synthase (NADPH) large chain [Streptococcus pneumoniae]